MFCFGRPGPGPTRVGFGMELDLPTQVGSPQPGYHAHFRDLGKRVGGRESGVGPHTVLVVAHAAAP